MTVSTHCASKAFLIGCTSSPYRRTYNAVVYFFPYGTIHRYPFEIKVCLLLGQNLKLTWLFIPCTWCFSVITAVASGGPLTCVSHVRGFLCSVTAMSNMEWKVNLSKLVALYSNEVIVGLLHEEFSIEALCSRFLSWTFMKWSTSTAHGHEEPLHNKRRMRD